MNESTNNYRSPSFELQTDRDRGYILAVNNSSFDALKKCLKIKAIICFTYIIDLF